MVEVSKQLCHFILERVQPRVVSFEEQIGTIRHHLSEIYEREQNWKAAAQALVSSTFDRCTLLLTQPHCIDQVGIPLETGQKEYADEYKLKTYLKIARLYLEDDDPVQAEYSIQRATHLQSHSKDEELKIIYNFCYAKVLGKFTWLGITSSVTQQQITVI